jgi:hypothetical protein
MTHPRITTQALTALHLLAFAGCAAEDAAADQDELPSVERGGESEDAIDPDALLLHDDELPTLQALTPGEVRELREIATSIEAEGLDEHDERGRPALHYAMIEVRDPEDVARLGELQIHWDVMPLFESEQRMFADAKGPAYVEPPSDDTGAYVFALVPAALFNALLEAQRQDERLFPTMLLREVPEKDARASTPSGVSHDWLEEQAFVWDSEGGYEPLPKGAEGPVARARDRLAPRLEAVQAYASEAMVRILETFADATPIVLLNSTNVRVQLTLRSADPVFVDATGTARVIRRGWGNATGRAVDIRGANVVARQGLNRIRRAVDESNRANVRVRKNKSTTWCIDLKGDGAMVTTNFYTATNVCSFGVPSGGVVYDEDAAQTIDVRNARVSVLAYATDAWSWLREIAEHEPVRADILVGPLADVISSEDRPYATCGSHYGALATVTLPVVLGELGVVGPLLELTLGHVDLVFPSARLTSRGLTAHEYGHFALCSLMAETASTRFEFAWSDVILETIVPQALGRDRGLEHEASWLNEGFADFFAAQVAGGSNYFGGPGSISDGNAAYCPVDDDGCLENNFAFPDFAASFPENDDALHDGAVAAVTTTLLDVVDGHAFPKFDPTRDVPGNGGIWDVSLDNSTLSVRVSNLIGVSPRRNDEVVHAPGALLVTWMQKWAELTPVVTGLDKEDMLQALVAAMREHGANDSQICRVLAVHAPDGGAQQSDCLSLLPNDDIGIDPNAIALENGDLLTPTSLICTTPGLPGDNDLVCHWEDFSIDATEYAYRIVRPGTGELVDDGVVSYEIVKTATLPLPANITGNLRVEVQTVKGDRTSASAVTTLIVEPSQCGDGVIQGGEACDGDALAPGVSCDTSDECPACQCNGCAQLLPLCI